MMTGVSPHKEPVMPSFGGVFVVNLKQQADELTVDLLVIWDVKFWRSCDVKHIWDQEIAEQTVELVVVWDAIMTREVTISFSSPFRP